MRTLFTFTLLSISFLSLAQSLSLKEKQAIAELDFKWSEKRILEYYGSPVKVELEQLTFAGDMEAILFADSRGAQVAANAIATICDDKLGKEALQEKKITKVLLKNDKTAGPKMSIDKGVLTLSFGFATSSKSMSESQLREAIENQL